MRYYYKLNFPVKFLRDDIDVSGYTNSKGRIFSVKTQEYITPEAFNFLCSLGLIPNAHAYIFLRKPLETSSIHTDDIGAYVKRIWAINYTWGTDKSDMAWYKPLDTIKKKEVLVTTAGSDYTEYLTNEVEELERHMVNGLFLTRTDVPHSVTNYDLANDRWSLSVRILDILYDWNRIVKTLDPFIE